MFSPSLSRRPRRPVGFSDAARRGRAGFTIFEVAIAGAVMALGIATSIIAMQSSFKSIDVARDTTLASQILQSEMERLRLMAWNNTTTVAVDSICELPEKEEVSLSSMFTSSAAIASRFRVIRTVETDADRPSDVRYITIYVQWRTSDGRTQQRSFRSMYAKNGLYDYYYTLAH
jgi:Tfp pilus assembly protein PilV